MDNVTNIYFDRFERDLFHKAEVWGPLIDKDEYRDLADMFGVLRMLGQRNPSGVTWTHLERGRLVLEAIGEVAETDLEYWREVAKDAPETAGENEIIARPREAAQIIITAREQALEAADRALGLIMAALDRATRPINEKAEV